MRKPLIASIALAVLVASFARSEQSSGTLGGFLAAQGFAAAKLERRYGNHLFVPTVINGKRSALMIDTGAPLTLIDKNSAATIGLKVENTTANVGGVFGRRWERYSKSTASTIALGNCVVTNVPVALADESSMNFDLNVPPTGTHIPTVARLPHINGLLGAHEMAKFGMIIDCTRQMLYINPSGPNAAVSQKLAALLAERGFTRIPMRLDSGGHFKVPGALNGHPTHFIVDTGSSTTIVDKKTGVEAGISVAATGLMLDAGEGRHEQVDTSRVKELSIGDFTIPNVDILALNVSTEVLRAKSDAETNAGCSAQNISPSTSPSSTSAARPFIYATPTGGS